ncbi:MAG: hypothetical protein OEW75_13710 [Cyclobacteriaceae bacterium]|nr:hypothetical protein [Cyclobacteriaceae bacterium]
MKNGTRNLFIGLGIAAGALLTIKAITGKTGHRLKNILSEKLNHAQKKNVDKNKDIYI